MQQSYKKQQIQNSHGNEAGAYLVMYTVVLAFLLAMGGFAVDSARLFRANRALQKAVDAGALAGIAYRVQVGQAVSPDEMRNVACDTLVFNVQNDNIWPENDTTAPVVLRASCMSKTQVSNDPDGAGPLPSVNNGRLRLSVEADLAVPFYFMDIIPWGVFGTDTFGDFQTTTRAATVKLNPAAVSLVLDFSGSMACTDAPDGCSCLLPSTPPCPVENLSNPTAPPTFPFPKSEALKRAAFLFVNQFTENYDYISVVPYNISSFVAAEGDTPFTRGNFSAGGGGVLGPIFDATSSSNTNHSDALTTALGELAGAPIPVRNQAVVFFTDGTPTAGRFSFVNSPTGLTEEFMQNKVDFAQTTIAGTTTLFTFPSALSRSALVDRVNGTGGTLPYGHQQTYPVGAVVTDPSQQLDLTIPANANIFAPCTDQRSYTVANPDRFRRAYTREDFGGDPCPNNPPFLRLGGTTFGGSTVLYEEVPAGSDVDDAALHYEESFFNAALAAAENIITSNRRIYTVGLGFPAIRFDGSSPAGSPALIQYNDGYFGSLNTEFPGGAGLNRSPYQLRNNIALRNDGERRDYLLARIANDPVAVDYNLTHACHFRNLIDGSDLGASACSLRVNFNGGGFTNGQIRTWDQLNNLPRGEYLPTTEAAALQALFDRIARRIILRLIS